MERKNTIAKRIRKKILIVDNEINILKLLGYILAPDYDLAIKTNAVAAFHWLADGNDPDLIISSLRMPYLDGSCFIKNLKISGYYRNTPVIIISGDENLESIVKSFSFKVESYMGKPFNPITLKYNIEHLTA
ncbi:PleD family two-component system response regulator [Pedobacter sp. Leaf132]|uniref:response regulator n=1 Tax=Pedobacter sp. Leaf132 TaxID=2876557 RepID=UPI001E4B7CA0|nr:response regulator [Pedobacter sp. Leaf132]